jgi:hypothetical protein
MPNNKRIINNELINFSVAIIGDINLKLINKVKA